MAEFPTYEQMAKNVAEKALDEFLYDGKSIREWMKIIVEQEPKTGHWKRNETIRLTYCSECGFGQHIDEFRTYNYCPNCGAKMIEPKERSDKDADKKCTYKETGCGSCKRQLDCPIEADMAESEDKE